MVKKITILFTVLYIVSRFFPVMMGEMVWGDGVSFTFSDGVMIAHIVLGLALHLLAVFSFDSEGRFQNKYSRWWVFLVVCNVGLMSVASFFFPFSRGVSGFTHWAVNIALTVPLVVSIWRTVLLCYLLWTVDLISISLFFTG